MDGGPYRTTRPVERRSASRPESTRQTEERQPASESPKPVHHKSAPRHLEDDKPFFKRLMWPLIILIIVLFIGLLGWLVWSNMNKGGGLAIDSSKYQAVFFTNGQVYFGKLQASNESYLKLTDIFYLQSQQSNDKENPGNPQETSTNQNDVQLIKLGDEIHGPEDEMIISEDQILFYENLKPNGKVAQSIQKFKDSK